MFRLTIFLWLVLTPGLKAQHALKIEDAPGSISFTIRNFGISVYGTFNRIQGTILFDLQNISTAYFEVTVPVQSISTGIALRDRHLLKEEYFYADQYGYMTFISESIMQGEGKAVWVLKGKLKIKEVSRSIMIPFQVKNLPDKRLIFEGEFKLNRRDFGVGGKSVTLGDDVFIALKVVAAPHSL